MKVVKKFTQNNTDGLIGEQLSESELRQINARHCPSCLYLSLSGMPGGRDALCTNCGYKDPCCYD